MPDGFRDRLEEEIPDWVDEGLVEPDQARRILERYPPSSSDEADGLEAVLYAVASILLGASVVALVLVGIDPGDPEPVLSGLGVAVSAVGVGLVVLDRGRAMLADALLVAGLVPLTAAVALDPTAGGPEAALATAGLGLPAVLLAWRRERPFVPALSVVAFTVTSGFAFVDIFGSDPVTKATAWLAFQGLLVAGIVVLDRWRSVASATSSVALAVAGLGASLVYFLAEGIEVSGEETVELALGGAMLVVIGLGSALRHRGLVLGGSIVLGLDAFVFAFTVGGPWLGTTLLAGSGLALIWQAEALKEWLADPA